MKFNFKKISAIATSVLMVGMTMGVAAAANYPNPFVVGGAANVAIVYGSGEGRSELDILDAKDIEVSLQSYMSSSGSSTTVTGGTAWQVGTSSDNLEIGEAIRDVETYIGKEDLGLLADGIISNEKGDGNYKQYLYFEDTTSSAVNYTEDDNDNIGLFFKIKSGKVIARYVMDFTTNLKSDIETTGELSDIEDKSITFLDKTYTIVDATNGTAGTELTLMSGALGGTINNDETITLGDYSIRTVISSATEARFTITKGGVTDTTDKMAKGGMEKLSDGKYLAVTDITYESYAGGLHTATFYIGADKIEWKNGTDMTSNGETINEAGVIITQSESGGDISIGEIAVNMTAEDDLYVPVGGKLSEADNLDEPEVLVGQNWDIEFKGLEAAEYEDISLTVSESDQQYTLKFKDYNGVQQSLPLAYANASGVYWGDDMDKRLVLNPNGTLIDKQDGNITQKDYFLLHTDEPKSPTSNAKTLLVQYMSADKVTDTNPKVTFRVNGVDEEISLATDGKFTLKAAGGTFSFVNESSGASNNFNISLNGPDYASGEGTINNSVDIYIRTYYNTLINISRRNVTDLSGEQDKSATGAEMRNAPVTVNVSIDDGNKDGDDNVVAANAGAQIFEMKIGNSSTTPYDATSTITKGATWQTDNSDSTVEKFIGNYGYEIVSTTPSSSPTSIEAKVPKSIVKPLLYVSTGDIDVSSTMGGTTQLGAVVFKDTETSSYNTKNVIVVGGSCINSAAAALVGGAYCTAEWTEKTGIGSGQFLIKGYATSSITSKVALLVAGYDAADTVNAATYLRNKLPDTSKEYKGTSATTAELVTTETATA